jgi:molecular chaperone HtpG
MVAEQVRVVSRSYQPDAQAVEWISEGGTNYALGPADKAERGTRIEIKLKEDAAEFAATWRLEQIIHKHSDYIAFPIYVGDSDQAVNQKTALWRQSPLEVTEEQYGEFYRHLTLDLEKPLLHTHLVTDAPISLRSLLYIPTHRERGFLSPRTDHGLRLYVHNVMIQEYNKDLLPDYLRFVEGVVESEDLPLNISREVIQRSPVGRRIQKALVRKLLKELETLAESDPEAYAFFWNEFGPFIKEGVAAIPSADTSAKEDLLPLLRFHSSRANSDLISLSEYVERMGEEQGAIYYVLGNDLESVAQSPHLDYFRAREIEVLYLADPIDSFVAMALPEYEDKPFKNVDSAGLELPQDEDDEKDAMRTLPEPDFNRLVGRFVKVLGDRVVEVRESKVLRDSPCRLVSPEDNAEREMSRVYRMLGREFQMPKLILEINRSHPIVANLAHLISETPEADLIDASIEQLFDNMLLLEGLHPNPANMIPRIQQLVEAATAKGSVQTL